MSKRVFNHPKEEAGGRKYWRSLGQLNDTPEFRQWMEREFPQGASEFLGGDVSRRAFLSLMGASTALAGLSLTGCRRPEKHLVPFTKGVEWSIPGKALFYATAMPTRRGYSPLIATTYDSRPTKIEGNPLHPISNGASGLYEQASVLDLYDVDRVRVISNGGKAVPEADFEKALEALFGKLGDGDGLAFLLQENNSPTRERLRGEIEKKYPKALWTVYEPVGAAAAVEAHQSAFGQGMMAKPDFSKADVILSFDCDFLGIDGDIAEARAYAARRKAEGGNKMNRLYVVENRYTVTGGMADHRLRAQASQIGALLLELANLIGNKSGDAALKAVVGGAPTQGTNTTSAWLQECADDLIASRGKSLVLVGPRQSVAVQALALSINSALGNLGNTLVGRRSPTRPAASISALAKGLADKTIKTLVIVGGNPAYNAPADLNFTTVAKNAETVIRLSYHDDETSTVATWNVPLAHYLESWGDGLAADGSYVSVQPMILPLFGGWSELDILARFAGLPKPKGPELIQATFQQFAGGADFATAWPQFLHDGFLKSNVAPEPLTLNADAIGALAKDKLSLPAAEAGSFEVVLVADTAVDDGRYANNGWLQEFPDPISKQTWDNSAWISPKSASDLGLEMGDVIEVTVGGAKIEIPVCIVPGHADNSLTIPLGYGRTKGGKICTVQQSPNGQSTIAVHDTGVGFNAYPLTTSAEQYIRVGAKVRSVGKNYVLAITQEHGSLEGRGADIVREVTLEDFKKEPAAVKTMGMDAHVPDNRSLYAHPPLNDIHQWGMTVDLNSCTGCGTCMVACQAENNIPIVGKRQVIDGREMHWIRCDRYFASGPNAKGEYDADTVEPEMVSQPMLCQHCENAPCETVCPVNATVHSEDGLNVMAYNRCIGTRYCANNCPFKVRRFNFFDYNQRQLDTLRIWNADTKHNPKGMEDTLKMSKNPNVTVRMRGVMEKCTFCVQRIEEAKIAAKAKGRDSADVRIPADAFTVACAQVCPTEAIVFGDISNPESSVSKVRASERGYELLKYLNINTRVLYLARIRNPNPKMPGFEKVAAYVKSPHPHHPPGQALPEKANQGGTH